MADRYYVREHAVGFAVVDRTRGPGMPAVADYPWEGGALERCAELNELDAKAQLDALAPPDDLSVDERPACERLAEELDLQRVEAFRANERAHDLETRLTYVLEAHDLYDADGVFTFPDGEVMRRSGNS